GSVSAQSKLDSLLNTLAQTDTPTPALLMDIAWAQKAGLQYQKARETTNQAIELAREMNDSTGWAKAIKFQGILHFEQGALTESLEYLSEAERLFKSLQSRNGIISTLNVKGQVYGAQGKCIEAIKAFRQVAAQLRSEEDDLRSKVAVRINLTAALLGCYQYETTLKTAQSILPNLEQANLAEHRGSVLNMIGSAYDELGQYDSAQQVFRKAIDESIQKGDSLTASVLKGNLAIVLIHSGVYSEALTLLEEARAGMREFTLNDGNFEVYKGQALAKSGKGQEAIPLLRRGIDLVKARGDLKALFHGWEAMAQAQSSVGDNTAAFLSLQKAMSFKDSLRNLQIAGQVQELNTRFETERISFALKNAELEIDLNRQRLFLLSSVLGAVILLGVVAYLVFSLQMRRKFYEAQQRQKELEYSVLRTQMNPHFIFNALNSIQGFFADQDFIRGNDYLGAFAFLMRKILNQAGRKEISLEEEIETLKLYLELEQARLHKQLQYEIRLNESVEAAWIMIPPLILQPFVENAVWHGIAPKKVPGHVQIDLSMNAAETHLLCTITDDGVGLGHAPKSQHTSKGISITRERLGPEGKVSVQDRTGGNGVEVKLQIPV
ncbi:MAG: histidine kinase, partial [Bacteroidota bacterium]